MKPFADNASSDEYVPSEDESSDECSSDDGEPVLNKTETTFNYYCNKLLPSDNVIETIEDVVRWIMNEYSTENENSTTNDVIWNQIDDNSMLPTLIFIEDKAGIKEEIF